MDALRVAYLVEQCWHRVPGGTAVASAELASALFKRNVVEIKGIAARHYKLPEVELPKDFHIQHSKLPRPLLYRSWQSLQKPRVEKMVGECDLVHATGGAIPSTERPFISTIYDLSWRHNPEWSPPRGIRFAEEWLKNSSRADLVVCPSETTRRDLVAAGFDSKKLRVINLGVNHQVVEKQNVQSLRDSYELDGFFVLWLGTIEPRKNLPVLIEAISKIPDISLVIVGPKGWKVDIEEVIRPVKDRVRLVGKVDNDTKQAWLKAADVFCYPSLLEGFGLPVVEAMSHGTPVITSATTATAEIVGDSGLLVNPENADEIVEAISEIIKNQDLSKDLSRKGTERSKDFTWDNSAKLTEQVYKEVVVGK